MTIKECLEIVGNFSEPSKLPCYSYNIPAVKCRTGSKLRKVPGSVCFDCYALKGLYVKYRATVNPAQDKRLASLSDPRWVESMSYLINTRKLPFFRWFDSGDLQSVEHLKQLVDVANNCKGCKFWLPTREYVFVSRFVRLYGKIPSNLNLRLSAHFVDGKPPTSLAQRLGVRTSTVTRGKASCPAKKQNNKCMDCRACWGKALNVSYQYQ